MTIQMYPRQLAVLILATLACAFAGNHIAARLAFDAGAGLLLAILCRSGATALALACVVTWRRESPRLPAGCLGWQVLAGLLVGVQSLCIYSAVVRIPVGLALLVVNLSPVFLALFTWLFGGSPPTRRAALLMGGILCGLLIVLDVPHMLGAGQALDGRWLEGVLFSVGGAVAFALALWITGNRLAGVGGALRSLWTMGLVFAAALLAGWAGVFPGALALPQTGQGWWALALLVVLYGAAFSTLFICMPRLDIARNAPVMNVEPVAGLLLGWVVLDQTLAVGQLAGGVVVIACIVLLALPTSRKAG